MIRLLYIEDVSLWQSFVQQIFQEDPAVEIAFAGDTSTARTMLDTHRPNIILLDLGLPDQPGGAESSEHGLKLLQQICLWNSRVPVIVVTQHGTEVPLAVQAMKLGAVDYILKRDEPSVFDEIRLQVHKYYRTVAEQERLETENQARAEALQGLRNPLHVEHFGGLIGGSSVMQSIYGMVERIARTDATVLLLGERGTGKNLLAKTIHEQSHRADRLFYPVSMPRFESNELLLDEMFGHVKGAFTGATSGREGIFEHANGGTVFLDEIGEIDRNIQAKLLQVIEDKSFKRVGDNQLREVDVRLIAATNRDLTQAVAEDRFRADLYDRLNVISITLPPLRERREDLLLLIPHFLEQYCTEYRKEQVVGFTSEALQFLQSYHYPGNVRELKHFIERAVVLCQDTHIGVEQLPTELRSAPVMNTPPLNHRQQHLLQLMESGAMNSITNQSYRKLVYIGHNTAHRDLTELVEHGYLIPEGAGRSTHYHLSGNGP